MWHDIAGRQLGDELLDWAPDLFAFTDVLLDRSEAYRFAVSPPEGAGWPPPEMPDWDVAIAEASVGWCAWVEGDGTKLPGLVAEEWAVVCERSATTLDELSTGRAWRVCQALITLHAIADEACAGTGVAVADVPRDGQRFRARARELLARTGTLSRIGRQRLRVVPRVRNPAGGPSIRSLSRYVCVRGPGVDAVWNRIPARTVGPGGAAEVGNVLMLPWPLRIDAEDFKPTGAVERAEFDPSGFFEFAPGELLDLDLADRVLESARNQEGPVEIVVLPESALRPDDIDELEALLTRHGVWLVVAGVREPPDPGVASAPTGCILASGSGGVGGVTARTSTTGGSSTASRSSSTTWLPHSRRRRRRCGGGRPSRCQDGSCRSWNWATASPWCRSFARIWPASTRWPTCFGPSGRPLW